MRNLTGFIFLITLMKRLILDVPLNDVRYIFTIGYGITKLSECFNACIKLCRRETELVFFS